MVFGSKTKRHPGGTTVTTTTTTTHHPPGMGPRGARKPTMMQKLRSHKATPVATTAAPARRSRLGIGKRTPVVTAAPRRKTTTGDKMSGAMTKLKGSVTGNPGSKAAGTRRMHGTDGRRSTRFF